MKITRKQTAGDPAAVRTRGSRGLAAFTLLETCVALALVGVFLITFFTCLTMGTSLMRCTRENERANQVLIEKFEAIRLYNWDQISSNGYIPATFTAPFDPIHTNNSLTFSGTVTITNTPIGGSYSNDLKLVTVQLTWPSGNTSVTQSMSSFVAHYGMQNYIY